MHVYESLLDAIDDLNSRGFTTDFKLNSNSTACANTSLSLSPDRFEIVEYYRFEADTNPDESSVLYVIQSIDGKIKGILINSYGIYSDNRSDSIVRKLRILG